MQDFVHLHVHTQYSLLDGQAGIVALVNKAIKDGMKGIAITDHGNMFGIKEFYNYVNKKNEELVKTGGSLFKPIIGCEMYVAHRTMDKKEGKSDQSGYHLIVLAKNRTGYHHLIKLVSKAWTEGYYSRPRTDRNELEKYHEGLIVCSACLGGEVPKRIIQGQLAEAEEAVQWYKNLFGDDYYLELQRHKATIERANHEVYPMQVNVNKTTEEFARNYHIKLICTNDVHFVNEEHAEAHDHLICLNTGKDLDDPTRMIYTKQEWMKTRQEMNVLFADIPEALSNTLEIYDKVSFYSIDNPPIMPAFAIPEEFGTEEGYRQKYSEQALFDEFTQDENGNRVLEEMEAEKKISQLGGYDKLYRIKLEADYLKKLTCEGAEKRYGNALTGEIKERMNFELYVMKTMGFPGYFLIVQDFIAAARKMGVSVGPGRGSVAGSVVAYCLEITQIDPIKYDLLFERFLNPDRISLPDIDIDFDDDGRNEVLRWVTEKYGKEKVAHIITYGTMAAKSSIKDVARVQRLPLSESDRLTKLIPDRISDKDLTLSNVVDYVPELKAAEVSSNPMVRNTIKYAKMLEGNVRNIGVHACGTIICRDDITDWVPVCTTGDKESDKKSDKKILMTQYEGSVIEETGLVKMDFLGLKTLSIIKETLENIRLRRNKEIDIDAIPPDNPATYRLYSEGRTIGTFQFESAGMQKYLRELQPTTLEDLIAMNALYRPGPMEYIPDFIDRKHGRKPIVYDFPIMEKYLKDTYGITVYQEQVMLLSRLLAGFTRGESDTLRKAMGKKLRDKLYNMKPKFIEGGSNNGYDPKVLEKIWTDWEKFASYAFNKSHATCYSWVAYQTAYLKANYPAEYMAAVMSRNISNITEITKLMDECKAMGIKVFGPDVNESNLKFTVNAQGNIRFGLGAIKGVGEGAVQSITEERAVNGLFKNIFDFVQRVNLNTCNKKNMESLALAGSFDGFSELMREQYFAVNGKNEVFLETLIRYGNRYQTDKAVTVNSLFGDENMVDMAVPDVPVAERWNDLERLNKEKELIGIYLSAHPLDEYAIVLNYACNTRMAELGDIAALAGREITMGGIVAGVRKSVSKNGNPYGVLKMEDYSGAAELTFWGNDYVTFQGYFEEGLFLYINARCQSKQWRPNESEIKITSMNLLSNVKEVLIEKITIFIPLIMLNTELITELSTLVKKRQGKTELHFQVMDTEEKTQIDLVSRPVKIEVGRELIDYIKECQGMEFRIN